MSLNGEGKSLQSLAAEIKNRFRAGLEVRAQRK
jgi:hypothetical protein